MARVNGTFKQGFLTSAANADSAIDAWLTLMDTDVGTATEITMNINIVVAAENAGADPYSYKLSTTCAAATLAKAKLQVGHLVTTALTGIVVTDGAYATINTIEVSVSATMTN